MATPGMSPSNAGADARRRFLLEQVGELARTPGIHTTRLEGLSAYRADEPTRPTVVEYRLSICFALQGRKRVHFGGEEIDYGGLNGLLVGLPLPLQAQVVEATPECPCLALVLEIEPSLVRETAEAMDRIRSRDARTPAVGLLPLAGDLLDVTARIARAAASESDAMVLGDALRRELVYRVLESAQGELLRSLATSSTGVHRIERVVRFLNENITERVTVAQMAAVAHMSESTLHQTFKDVTTMSPLQYLKRMRLQTARSLMLDASFSANEAAHEVGYRSASQFSREFKALYGVPPSRAHLV